jgi:prevent-host-death family protein
MKSFDEAEARARLDEILEEAQRQPVVIRRQGEDRAVVLSIAEYERLRADAVRAFLDLRNHVASDAKAAGLTESQLTTLLSGD